MDKGEIIITEEEYRAIREAREKRLEELNGAAYRYCSAFYASCTDGVFVKGEQPNTGHYNVSVSKNDRANLQQIAVEHFCLTVFLTFDVGEPYYNGMCDERADYLQSNTALVSRCQYDYDRSAFLEKNWNRVGEIRRIIIEEIVRMKQEKLKRINDEEAAKAKAKAAKADKAYVDAQKQEPKEAKDGTGRAESK